MEPIEKLYVEASTLCNLDCTMCMRQGWKGELLGHMDMNLYRKLIEEVKGLKSIHTIFFGGVGEPMFHPDFVEMVRMAKSAGKRVECVTNGTLMTPDRAQEIIEAGLDKVWFSVDGFDEQNEENAEHGSFALVKQNLLQLGELRRQPRFIHFQIGLTFVAMKDNIHHLMDLMLLAMQCGAKDIKISHVLPYTEEYMQQALFFTTLKSGSYLKNRDREDDIGTPTCDCLGYEAPSHVDFPLMDWTEQTTQPLISMLKTLSTFSVMGDPLCRKEDYCRFVQENNVFVKWNGDVSPCMGLLHPSETFLNDKHRIIKPKSYGNISAQTLMEIWSSEAYASFRDKVRRFDFPPCTSCGGCDRIVDNEDDCFANEHPTCGACLWAQGFIQCP